MNFLTCRCRDLFVSTRFSFKKNAPIFCSKRRATFLISRRHDLCLYKSSKAKLRQLLFQLWKMSRLFVPSGTVQQSPVRDRPVLCFFRGDLIDSSSLDTLCTISGFILAFKNVYYCTSAATLVCQPQSAFVSPTVRTYYIVVCFRHVSLFILHILQCLMNKYLYSVIHFGFDFSALY